LRILVDRLWPRSIRKEDAGNELRKWFGHDPERYDEFAARYRQELDTSPAAADFLELCHKKLAGQDVILLYAAKDEEHNNAVVLREWLLEKL
jgi:transcriptional regulator, MarR family